MVVHYIYIGLLYNTGPLVMCMRDCKRVWFMYGNVRTLHEIVIADINLTTSNSIDEAFFLVGFSQMFQFVGNRMEHCLGSSVNHFAEIAAIESSRLENGRPNLLWKIFSNCFKLL